jgi:choline dehydrogenase
MYDYIIVGAGSAGCVLARRLSDNPQISVLLLEAGGSDEQREVHIPAAFSKLFKGPCDWAYTTEPQDHLHGRRLYWPRGKLLGGSSSMNAMIYIRGQRTDYDRWHDLGNKGWNYSGVLPYFRRAEDQERGPSEYHGVGGPLHVADLRTINPVSRAFVEAGVELGLPHNQDFNGPEQDGVGYYQVTQRRGRRHSAAAAYLKPVLDRPNLTVRTHTHVTRVRFEGHRAAGVLALENGKPVEYRAGREVLLSGGAINSPQLLLLSGIGPGDALRSLGIPVVADLPGVGQNLQDHLAAPVAYACTCPVSLSGAETFANLLRFLLLRRGPLTSNIAESGGFVRTRPGLPAADVQFHFAPVFYLDHGFTRPEGHGFTIGPTLLHPESRGRIRLRSTDPLAAPAIEPNYLDNPVDLAVLVEGIKLARRLARAKVFDRFRGAEISPSAEFQEDDALADYVRARAETLYHPVGTCKMGNDPLAVVDSRLRVHGVDGLRVIDASIMPEVVGGNTNAPTLMIAERGAEEIRTQE